VRVYQFRHTGLFLVEHDPFGKPATTFPDHTPGAIYIFGRRSRQKENRAGEEPDALN
jgi:hypothetical protein